jgi:hypothetical protein
MYLDFCFAQSTFLLCGCVYYILIYFLIFVVDLQLQAQLAEAEEAQRLVEAELSVQQKVSM